VRLEIDEAASSAAKAIAASRSQVVKILVKIDAMGLLQGPDGSDEKFDLVPPLSMARVRISVTSVKNAHFCSFYY
jgi:hypothetical protein